MQAQEHSRFACARSVAPSTSTARPESLPTVSPPASSPRCAACPAARKKTNHTLFMRPLFVDEGTPWSPADLPTQQQAHALREAIAPYLCLSELRRLAASGASVLDALKSGQDVPEEVQALMNLLQVLLAATRNERITQPADL